MIKEKAIETLEIEAEAVLKLKARIDDEFEAAVKCILDCKARVVVTGMENLVMLDARSRQRLPALVRQLFSCIQQRLFMAIWVW